MQFDNRIKKIELRNEVPKHSHSGILDIIALKVNTPILWIYQHSQLGLGLDYHSSSQATFDNSSRAEIFQSILCFLLMLYRYIVKYVHVGSINLCNQIPSKHGAKLAFPTTGFTKLLHRDILGVITLLAAAKSWTRDRIRSGTLVDVEENPGVVGTVEAGANCAARTSRAAAGDLQVDALRVELGAVRLVATVQGNDLVAQDVVPGSQVAGDGDLPLVAVADELVRRPDAVGQALLGNLEPLEAALVGAGAAPAAAGQVVDDGTLVRIGPCVPLEGDGLAGTDRNVRLSRRGLLVADDIRGAGRVGLNKTKILLRGPPAWESRRVGLVPVDGGVVVGCGCATCRDGLDEAVCGNGGRGGQGEQE